MSTQTIQKPTWREFVTDINDRHMAIVELVENLDDHARFKAPFTLAADQSKLEWSLLVGRISSDYYEITAELEEYTDEFHITRREFNEKTAEELDSMIQEYEEQAGRVLRYCENFDWQQEQWEQEDAMQEDQARFREEARWSGRRAA